MWVNQVVLKREISWIWRLLLEFKNMRVMFPDLHTTGLINQPPFIFGFKTEMGFHRVGKTQVSPCVWSLWCWTLAEICWGIFSVSLSDDSVVGAIAGQNHQHLHYLPPGHRDSAHGSSAHCYGQFLFYILLPHYQRQRLPGYQSNFLLLRFITKALTSLKLPVTSSTRLFPTIQNGQSKAFFNHLSMLYRFFFLHLLIFFFSFLCSLL